MARVTGLGGVFYKVADPEKTRGWYQETLGIGGEWGAMFPFKQDDGEGFSLFSQFKNDTDYFGPSNLPFMVNLRVDDIDDMVADLEAKTDYREPDAPDLLKSLTGAADGSVPERHRSGGERVTDGAGSDPDQRGGGR